MMRGIRCPGKSGLRKIGCAMRFVSLGGWCSIRAVELLLEDEEPGGGAAPPKRSELLEELGAREVVERRRQ